MWIRLGLLMWTVVFGLWGVGGAAAQTDQDRLTAVRKQIEKAELFDFGKVRSEDAVEHTFQFRNPGTGILELKDVQLTPPLAVTKMSRQVQPGGTGTLTVRLGQPRQAGDFEGLVVVRFAQEDAPNALFRVQGRVVRSIDFEPLPAFYVTTFKGEPKEQSIDITNYGTEPLKTLKVEHDSSRFSTDLTTLEPGRRYRLAVKVKETAPVGKAAETIRLLTSDERRPVISIPANTQVRDRVYTFPDSLALGLIDTPALKKQPQQVSYLTQSVMAYQRNGTDFQIAADTDVPFLRITKRQAQLKDRFEVVAEVIPEKLKAGSFNGSIHITTNDAEFPRLVIPVTCQVNADW